MKRAFSIACAAALFAASTTFALSAEPIEGNWKTEGGSNAKISKCGGSFCITLTSGEFKGKSIGKVKGSGANYSGTVIDPEDNKEYSGKAKVTGNKMNLKGCVFGGIICRGENWIRQ